MLTIASLYILSSVVTHATTYTSTDPTTTYTETSESDIPTSDVLSTVTYETWTTIQVDNVPTESPTITPACQAPIGTDECNSAWSVWSTAAGQPWYWWEAPFLQIEEQSTPSVPLTGPPPTPNCVQAPVGSSSCDDLQSQAVWPLGIFEPIVVLPELAPANQGPDWPSTYSLAPGCTLGCGKCTLTAGHADLLYWPATTNGSNITGPATTILDGYTLTSPSLYLSFNNIVASNWCASVGSNHTNAIVPVASNHLSIMELDGLQADLTAVSFDVSSWSQLVSQGISSYLLSIPPEIDGVDPAWASCVGLSAGVWDPPTALQPASAIAGVSTSAGHGVTSSKASPAPTVPPSTAKATRTESDVQPSSTQQPASSTDVGGGGGTSPSVAVPTAAPESVGGNGGVSGPNSDGSPSANPSEIATSASDDAASPSAGSSDLETTASPSAGSADSAPNSLADTNTANPSAGSGDPDNTANPSTESDDPATTPLAATNALSVLSAAENTFTSANDANNGPTAGSGQSTAQAQDDPGTSGAEVTSGGPLPNADSPATSPAGQVNTAAQGDPGSGQSPGSTAATVGSQGVPQIPGSQPQSTVITAGSGVLTVALASGASQDPARPAVVVSNAGSAVTLSAGAAGTTLNGQQVSVASGGGIVIGLGASATTAAILSSVGQEKSTAVLSVGGQALSATQQVANGQTEAVINGQTLTQGGAAVTFGGQAVSFGSSGLAAGSSSVQFAAARTGLATIGTGDLASPVTQSLIDGKTGLIVGSATLLPGSAATVISGMIVSAASSGLVEAGPSGTTTIPYTGVFGAAAETHAASAVAVFTVSGTAYTASEVSNGVFALQGTTFYAGSAAVTLSGGEVVSAGTTDIVVDGSTIAVQSAQETSGGEGMVLLTASSGMTITAVESPGASTAVVDGSVTLSVGGPGTVIKGESISLASGGLVAQGSTVPFTPQAADGAEGTVLLTASSGETLTAVENPGASTAVIDGSVTLSVGGLGTVIDGESLSLASSGLVVRGSTVAFSGAASAGVTTGGNTQQTAQATGSREASATSTSGVSRTRSGGALWGLIAVLAAVTVLL